MSKTNALRKKALEYVRKRDWPKAIKEYKRLADLDKNNPNIFNELGDLYLKVGNKHDAFESFDSAIEAYSRVSLFNNAIAVCKKILRLSPNRLEVLFSLGRLRKAQGLEKEAVSYFNSYMDKLVFDVSMQPADLKVKVESVYKEMESSTEIVEKVADLLLKWEFRKEGIEALMKLRGLYSSNGDGEKRKEVEVKLKVLGCDVEDEPQAPAGAKAETAVSYKDKSSPHGGATETAEIPTGSRPDGDGDDSEDGPGLDYGEIKIDDSAATSAPPDAIVPPAPGNDRSEPSGPANNVEPAPSRAETACEPGNDSKAKDKSDRPAASEKGIHVSKIVDEFKSEIKDAIDDEDYRSHYDLGMAYLEMDLLPEAIHEFQLASKAGGFQVKSLEMIGLCFMKQNQPELAIKQLEKGLSLVSGRDTDSLGLIYTLGLAYEMIEDTEKAKNYFEDVYVVDVAFRDVSEKIKHYAKNS